MHYNLVEDENEAKRERLISNFGFILVIVGGILLYLHWKTKT